MIGVPAGLYEQVYITTDMIKEESKKDQNSDSTKPTDKYSTAFNTQKVTDEKTQNPMGKGQT